VAIKSTGDRQSAKIVATTPHFPGMCHINFYSARLYLETGQKSTIKIVYIAPKRAALLKIKNSIENTEE